MEQQGATALLLFPRPHGKPAQASQMQSSHLGQTKCLDNSGCAQTTDDGFRFSSCHRKFVGVLAPCCARCSGLFLCMSLPGCCPETPCNGSGVPGLDKTAPLEARFCAVAPRGMSLAWNRLWGGLAAAASMIQRPTAEIWKKLLIVSLHEHLFVLAPFRSRCVLRTATHAGIRLGFSLLWHKL